MTESLWINAYDKVKVVWAEDSAMIDCPCGMHEIVLSSESDPKVCRCGRVYRFVTIIQMQEKPAE